MRPVREFEDDKVIGRTTTVFVGSPRPVSPKLSMYQVIRNSSPGSIPVLDAKGTGNHFTVDNQGWWARWQGRLSIIVYGETRGNAGFRRMSVMF